MRRALMAFIVLCLGLVPTGPALAQDDGLEQLLELRQATLEELTDVSLQLAQIELRRDAPNWIIVPVSDGSYAQISLKRVDELVPWVQMALADQEAAATLADALGRYYPEAAIAAMAPEWLVQDEWLPYHQQLRYLAQGELEKVDPDMIRQAIRAVFTNPGVRTRLDVDANYAALDAELEEQRQALHVVLGLLDADIEARGGALSPDASPDPCEADGENAVDILCSDWGDDATREPEPGPTWEPSLPPTEVEELPSSTIEPEPSPETTPGTASDGVEYDAMKGLTSCEEGDPDCVEATPNPCSESDMWCDDTASGPSGPPSPSLEPSPAPSPDPVTSVGGDRAAIICEGGFAGALEPPYTEFSPEQIGACFDDCQAWISWHGSFGDVLPSLCSENDG